MAIYNRRTQCISDLISLEDKNVIRFRKPGNNKNRTGKDCFRRTFDIRNKFIEHNKE